MSGARNEHEELVYCHACRNEFYKEGERITCPQCGSDFTELIDQDFDPEEGQEEPSRGSAFSGPFAGHSPWNDADDPDEEDIDQYARVPGSSWRDRRSRQTGQQGQFMDPVFGNFASMIQGITGQQQPHSPHFTPMWDGSGPPGYPRQQRPQMWGGSGPSGYPTPQPPQPGQGYYGSLAETGQSQPTGFRFERFPSQPLGGGSFNQRQAGGGSRSGGIQISFSSSTNGRGWQTNQAQFNDFNELFGSIFGNTGAPPPGARGTGGQPLNPLAAIFGNLMNPANAQHGDAVYSQEAFDRIMSQLMEQHQTGGAPGPATEAAIAALPKKKITEDMLDETTKQAECSICMDNVVVGEEVTVLPCSHWFHHPCAEAWLKEHDTCPVCRAGIMPKEGSRDTARAPTEPPLHDHDPFVLARQQSGTREHPFVIEESPTSQRRRPNPRRESRSSDQTASSSSRRQSGGAGLLERARNFFGGDGSGSSTRNDPDQGPGNSRR